MKLGPFCIVAAVVAQPTFAAAEDAGALLAQGRAADAAQAAASCRSDPRCALVLARALFGEGKLREAAEAAHAARSGEEALRPTAAKLEGEALLLSGAAREALGPLRFAAAADPGGPAGERAGALLADALLDAGQPAEARAAADAVLARPVPSPDLRAAMAWVAAQALAASGDARNGAEALRAFWLQHPEHPAAEEARRRELALFKLPEPSGHDLYLRAGRLLTAGQPGAAVAQLEAALPRTEGATRAEAELLHARALAADGRRIEAAPALTFAWQHGAPHVAAPAGMLLARDRARRGNDAAAIQLADAVARKYPGTQDAEESALFAARLLVDAGKRQAGRARLAKLAARRSGPNASLARWQLAWMSFEDRLPDAVERFAEFAATAATDAERAQGAYWQARAGEATRAAPLYRRAVELDGLGWYGLLARARLGEAGGASPPFPPPAPAVTGGPDAPRLRLAHELLSLGLLAEAAAEADAFVRAHPGDAGAAALPLYARAGRTDRAVTLAEALLGGRHDVNARALLEAAYPAAFPREVASSAARLGVDPYLVESVMRRESLFRPDTRSAAGAVGLLQLLPATARRAAAVLGRPPLGDDQLVTPAVAIDLGSWYLAELLGRFGDPAVALAAYNAGPRNAAPWAERGAGQPLDVWVEEIPYKETRRYVKVVIGAWGAYRVLAGGAPPRLVEAVPQPRAGARF